MERGKNNYVIYCTEPGHMEQVKGLGCIPPVGQVRLFDGGQETFYRTNHQRGTGEIKVNGKVYNGEMSGFDPSDEEINIC